MPPRRRVPVTTGRAAVDQWRRAGADTGRDDVATAVRYSLEELATVAPGRSEPTSVPW